MNTFQKTHFGIDRSTYKALKAVGRFARNSALRVEEIKPEFDVYYKLLQSVGGPWGWDRRPKYALARAQEIQARLAHADTRLFLLRAGTENVGYCLKTAYFDKISYLFDAAAQGKRIKRAQVCEIENFGLFPKYTGKGYGPTFLPLLFDEFFKDYRVIYLSSRSTNHAKVQVFYKDLGMKVTRVEVFPDDLGPAPK
jgi:hypothetical protein